MTTGLSYCLMALAFLVSTIAYPYVLAFARKHKVVDNPSARKLQRVPVPVMGELSCRPYNRAADRYRQRNILHYSETTGEHSWRLY